jgi:hypothetical protein
VRSLDQEALGCKAPDARQVGEARHLPPQVPGREVELSCPSVQEAYDTTKEQEWREAECGVLVLPFCSSVIPSWLPVTSPVPSGSLLKAVASLFLWSPLE